MKKHVTIIVLIYIFFVQNTHAFQKQSDKEQIIKIGLLVIDETSEDAQRAAAMAIELATIKEAINGKKFELITRSMEGSWGTGSKEAVNLVFNENVWAILGSNDGRNAHLAEQVIAKTRVVFLSAWASDPSLTQAFVPWFFNIVPNDKQQAKALINEIHSKRKISKIAIISEDNYDANLAAQLFLKEFNSLEKAETVQISYKTSIKNFENITTKIKEAQVNGIVIFGQTLSSQAIIRKLREKKLNQPIFGTPTLLGGSDIDAEEFMKYHDITFISSGNWFPSKESNFQKSFQKKYGKMPSSIAAYTFDGMNILIEGIRSSGFDREKFHAIMPKTKYSGVTGSVQFDENGNRLGGTELLTFGSEISVPSKK